MSAKAKNCKCLQLEKRFIIALTKIDGDGSFNSLNKSVFEFVLSYKSLSSPLKALSQLASNLIVWNRSIPEILHQDNQYFASINVANMAKTLKTLSEIK